MRDVAVVIDLGGGNTYEEGTVGPDRPVLVVINLQGNNTFPRQQGGNSGRGRAGRFNAAEPGRQQHL